MPVLVKCPHCGNALQVKDEFAGKRGKCPKCLTKFRVPKDPPPVLAAVDAAEPLHPGDAHAGKATSSQHQARDAVLQALSIDYAPPVTPLRYVLGAWLAMAVLVALPLVYWGAIVGLGIAAGWLLVGDTSNLAGVDLALPDATRYGLAAVLILAFVCLLKPLLFRQRGIVDYTIADRHKQPLLNEVVDRLSELLRASRPREIRLECSPRINIEHRRGMLGVVRGDCVLTVGLPAVASLSVQQLAGMLATELALHRRGSGGMATAAVLAINGWMWRSIFEADRWDAWLDRICSRPGWRLSKLLMPLKAIKWVSQIVLWVPMFIGNTVASGLVRRTLLDADRCHARLVGYPAFARALERKEMMEFAWQGILVELDFRHRDARLPDNLPLELAARMDDLTPELVTALKESVVKGVERPFDAKPAEKDRLEAGRAEGSEGVLHCQLPAEALVYDFAKLAREQTWEYYVSLFGPQRLKTAMVPVQSASHS